MILTLNRASSLWESVKKRDSWEATVQRGQESGRKGLALVRRSYQAVTSEDTAGRKIFVRVWKSAMAL
jgi:hypothetical protein